MQSKQYKKTIAYQGSEGANSHLACSLYFPKAKYKSYNTFAETFNAVEKKEVDLALIPIENSYAGRVSEIHHLLKQSPLYIVGEYFLDIAHHLIAVPGTKISDIKTVYSHPQALIQCTKNLNKYKFKTSGYLNTALAAKFIKEKNDKSIAALASTLAAEINGLEVIKENLQDDKNNKTIFVALAREVDYLENKSKKKITSLVFKVRNIPGAIYKSLGGFATNNINIIKLESYIPGGFSKEAQFFISFEGNIDDKETQSALEELGFYSKEIKLLGVYDQAIERITSVT